MESSPSYSSDDRDISRDRSRGEQRYQPSPPSESMFVDPRREEAPRAPIRTPLEGVIHIRPSQEAPAPDPQIHEAAALHMQQQLEAADADKDKKDKRRADDYYLPPTPTQPEDNAPAAPLAEEATAGQPEAEEPDVATEQDYRAPEQSAYFSDQNPAAEQPEPVREEPLVDGVQRAWYYTPPQPLGTEHEVAPLADVNESPVQPAPPAEYWQSTTPEEAAQQPLYAAEAQPAQYQPEASVEPVEEAAESAAWHYDAEQQPPAEPVDYQEQPAPYAAAYETVEDIDPAAANAPFGARTQPRPAAYQHYAMAGGMPPFGGGPNNPNTPNTPPSGPDGFNGAPGSSDPYNQYPAASTAGAPSARLERLLRNERQHSHRGLALGIVGGLLLEHHFAKSRDKKLSERIDKLQKENNQAQEQTYWANQEVQTTQQALRTEQQRSQEEIAKTRADVSGSPLFASAAAAGLAVAPNMAPRPAQQPERGSAAAPQTVEQQPGANPNQQPEYVDQQGNPIHLRPGERVKQSAWHTYVEKDGHVVEDAIDYGQGFRQEQQQERGHVQQLDNNQAGAQQGPVYGPMAQTGMYGAVNPSLPSGMTTPSLPAGQPTHADAQHQLPEHTKSGKQVASNLANPWFWLMLGLIFAAFFITVTV